MDFEQRNKMTDKTFGFLVREKHGELGLSMRALAEKLKISTVYLSDIENCNRPAPKSKKILNNFLNELCRSDEERKYMDRAAVVSRFEDIERYLKQNHNACIALRMSQELPEETVNEEWERFIKRLIEINSEKYSYDDNSNN